MKKIHYRWENWGFRSSDNDALDFLTIDVSFGKVIFHYGKPYCAIREIYPWLDDRAALDQLFPDLARFQADTDFEHILLDGWNETLTIDGVHLTHMANHPLAVAFIQTVNRLVGFDVQKHCGTQFRAVYHRRNHNGSRER